MQNSEAIVCLRKVIVFDLSSYYVPILSRTLEIINNQSFSRFYALLFVFVMHEKNNSALHIKCSENVGIELLLVWQIVCS